MEYNASMEAGHAGLAGLNDLPGPPGLPLVGNRLQFRLNQVHLKLEEWAKSYGPMYRIRIGPHRIAVVSDHKAIRQILLERPEEFRRTRVLEAVASELRLKGVFAAEGSDWRRQRRVVTTALNRAGLAEFFPKLALTVGRLQRRWERAADNGERIDLCGDLMRFTVDVTVQLAFGVDANTLETPGPVIQRHLDRVFPMVHRRLNAPFPWWRWLRLPSDRALDRSLDEIEREVGEMVRAARERMAAEPGRAPENFLEAIISAVETEGSGFSDAEIFANAGTLLLAGEDTTANSIAWAVHHFLEYPDYFDLARQEVDALVAPDSVLSSLDQTKGLRFLDAFCNESMRLKPVAPLHMAEPLDDAMILDCLIPKGTPIMMLARRVATLDKHFGEGARFNPERWLAAPENRCRPHDKGAFMPFGFGPRLCPGRNLALTQIRAVLAMLCRNFEIERLESGNEVDEHLAFTMLPTNLSVRLKRRDHS